MSYLPPRCELISERAVELGLMPMAVCCWPRLEQLEIWFFFFNFNSAVHLIISSSLSITTLLNWTILWKTVGYYYYHPAIWSLHQFYPLSNASINYTFPQEDHVLLLRRQEVHFHESDWIDVTNRRYMIQFKFNCDDHQTINQEDW